MTDRLGAQRYPRCQVNFYHHNVAVTTMLLMQTLDFLSISPDVTCLLPPSATKVVSKAYA